MGKTEVTDALRQRIRAELPEVEEITDAALRDQVVEAWAWAIAASSFQAIGDIKPSGNPDTPPLKSGTQADHMRGVTRLAMRIADELTDMFPDLPVNRDILIAGALCHDVGKPWEFDPENQARWKKSPKRVGFPSIRHPPSALWRARLPDRRPAGGGRPLRRRPFRRGRADPAQPGKHHHPPRGLHVLEGLAGRRPDGRRPGALIRAADQAVPPPASRARWRTRAGTARNHLACPH